jgi:hypothetical protein
MTQLQTPFDRLISAAKSLTPTEPQVVCLGDYEKVTATQSEPFVAANRGALNAAREALRSRCSIPLKYEESYRDECGENWESLRRLTRAFALELAQTHAQGRMGEAAKIGLDILELANVLQRGGVIVDFLVGGGCRLVALDQLRRMRFQLEDGDRAMLIRELPRLDADRDLFADVLERDRKWDTWVASLNLPNEPLDMSQYEMDPKECGGMSREDQRELLRCLQATVEAPEEIRHARFADSGRFDTALLRLLVIDLALRSYRAANRSFPGELGSLIPEYLGAIPLDPFTEGGFYYQKQFTDRFVLYSTGPGRVNHGATFGPWPLTHAGDFDLCLDTADYETSCCELEPYPRGFPGFVLRLRDAWKRWMG